MQLLGFCTLKLKHGERVIVNAPTDCDLSIMQLVNFAALDFAQNVFGKLANAHETKLDGLWRFMQYPGFFDELMKLQ